MYVLGRLAYIKLTPEKLKELQRYEEAGERLRMENIDLLQIAKDICHKKILPLFHFAHTYKYCHYFIPHILTQPGIRVANARIINIVWIIEVLPTVIFI